MNTCHAMMLNQTVLTFGLKRYVSHSVYLIYWVDFAKSRFLIGANKHVRVLLMP